MGIRRNLLRLLALLFAFAMVAAACGSSDDDDSSGSGSDSATATADDHGDDDHGEEEEDTSIGGGLSQDAAEKAIEGDDEEEEVDDDAPTFDRSTLDGIWEEAAYNRQKMVDKITAKMDAGEWGVGDDGILRGPAGFEIDMNDCPADWSDTTGITDSEIRIGHTTAQSGNLAAYGNIAVGWDNYLQWVNANGGVAGRDVTLLVKDDGYVAAQTIEFIDELIESENVFALLTLGSPNTFISVVSISLLSNIAAPFSQIRGPNRPVIF